MATFTQSRCVKVAMLQCGTGAAGRAGRPGRTTVVPVHWFFTGLLIAASAGTVAYTGYLVRRLFTTEPPADAAS